LKQKQAEKFSCCLRCENAQVEAVLTATIEDSDSGRFATFLPVTSSQQKIIIQRIQYYYRHRFKGTVEIGTLAFGKHWM
jgi:hypothetical protein